MSAAIPMTIVEAPATEYLTGETVPAMAKTESDIIDADLEALEVLRLRLLFLASC